MVESSPPTSRRKYLSGIAGIGFYNLSSQTSEPKTEIVTARKGDEILEKRKVHKRWKNHVDTIRKVVSRVKKRNLDNDEIHGVAIYPTDTKIGNRKKQGIVFHIDPDKQPRTLGVDLPDKASDIPIKKEERERVQTASCYTGSYSKAKGGIEIGGDTNYPKRDGVEETGSLCTVVERKGSKKILTARHVVSDTGEACGGSTSDTMVYQPSSQFETTVGDVAFETETHDAALINISGDIDPTKNVVDSTGKIYGYMTENAVDNYASGDQHTVHMRGRSSCTGQGEIKEHHATLITDNDCTIEDLVRTDISVEGGDSGGLVYRQSNYSDSTNYICNLINAKANSDCFGVPGYILNDQYDMSF
ncbi:trypsin-like serine protease [Haloarcula sp. CBA1122]|uniref:trypsin-like serine protease n=1 Tax=Haloarcula sp. CBA1122 TaxID=2668069 RepID=UPI00130CC884|nr:trypsin-like peptidase domain-containing protein [Haloarcula sp. CBA1122]MUV49710.1 hypothetical protein [Haloarcula sp. CBA1122]